MDILNIIKKTLKKKKETIILDLYIKIYNLHIKNSYERLE